MKIKPTVTEKIYTSHTSFVVDLVLDYNITFVVGDSGVGKSAIYSFIEELGTEDKRIKCINYLDYKKLYKNSVKNSKGKLFIIDNADILLDDEMRKYIAVDENNQYVIIGRNPTGLLLVQENFYELSHIKEGAKTIFRLVPAFG